MKKRFKRYHRYKISNIFIIFIIVIILYFLIHIIANVKLVNNDLLIGTILKDTNSYISYEKVKPTIIDAIFYLEAPFSYKESSNIDIKYYKSDLPIVYIYNTHDEEGYLSDYKEGYNLEPTIIDATKLLQNELNSRGIITIIEDRRVSEERKNRGLTFVQSYTISREFVIEKLDKYPNLKLIIDLHRDSLKRENSYVTYNDKNYAKVLFVMGKRYDTYKSNLALANKIDEKIKIKIPSLSKGIMLKDVAGHNGIYNQDLNTNMILLELGSNNNSVDEVYNTIMIVADAIEEVINEDKA